MVTGSAKPPKMRPKNAQIGKVTRDGAGRVTMIDFMAFEANKDAPAIFVNNVGGIYKIGENSVQVVFVVRLRSGDGELGASQVVSLIWDEQDWLATRKLFQFAMSEWERTKKGDGSRKRAMQAGIH